MFAYNHMQRVWNERRVAFLKKTTSLHRAELQGLITEREASLLLLGKPLLEDMERRAAKRAEELEEASLFRARQQLRQTRMEGFWMSRSVHNELPSDIFEDRF